MPISGSFSAFQATQPSYTGTPNALGTGPNDTAGPSPRHGQQTGPNTAGGPKQWGIGDNIERTGGGYPGASVVQPRMIAGGLMRDFSRYSDAPSTMQNGYDGGAPGLPNRAAGWIQPVDHAGTDTLRAAAAGDIPGHAGGLSDMATSALNQLLGNAHRDIRTTRISSAFRAPAMSDFAGQGQGVDRALVKGHGTAFTGRMLAKNHSDGFLEGSRETEYQVTYPDKGSSVDRRWAVLHYASPAIAGWTSGHALRGVLPNFVQTPYPQPGLVGGVGNKNSGIPANARHLPPSFSVPQIFRSPPSESALISIVNDGSVPSNTMGFGF